MISSGRGSVPFCTRSVIIRSTSSPCGLRVGLLLSSLIFGLDLTILSGLIYGFLSREDSDRLLLTQGALPGSFLIRFSDRCPGQFVVVYVTSSLSKKPDGGDEREVKHYLISPEDIGTFFF